MGENECQELKNIKYKTMLISRKPDVDTNITNNLSNIEKILEKECSLNKKEPWNKLDKTIKVVKIKEYIEKLSKELKLTTVECKNLKTYLISLIDKKKLLKVRDVIYDKDNQIIKNIPLLHFNNTTRKFTLKNSDKHQSTLKSLAPKKKIIKSKIDKIDKKD